MTITDDTVSGVTCDQGSPSGLAPGGTASCSGSYTTVQADVDASGVDSSATASLGGTSSAATLRVPWAATQGGVLPVLTIAGVSGGEDAGQFAFAVSLSAASQQTVTVAYATADGTATAGADYTGASGTLAFAPSETVKTIAVTVRDDELDETDESFTVELSAPSDEATPLNATFGGGGTPLSAPGTIADDDGTPVVGSRSAFEVAEGQTAVATLTATDEDHTAAELTWTIPPGTAGGADRAHFKLTRAGVLAFKAAKDYENADDADDDRVYAVTVQVSDGVNAARANLTVTLTDVVLVVSIAPVAATVEEGTAAAFTLTRSGDLSGAQTVAVAVSQTGSVLATGQAGERQVTFADGATEAALSVATDDDTVAEAGGTVTATVQSGTGYTLGASATAQVAVTDDDASGLTLTVQPDALAESDAATAVTVTAAWDAGTRAEATEVTVSVGGTGDTATEGTDYATVEDLSLTIAAGAGEATATFTLTPTGDAVDEADEALTVSATTSVTGLTVTAATLTITDDDTRGVTVSEDELDIAEGGSATYTVVLGSQPTDTVTVGVAGTADSDPDVTVSPATLTFTTGSWDTAQRVTVSGGQDADAEDDAATIEHTVSGGDYGANKVTAADVSVAVDDDETAARELTLALTVAHEDKDGSGDVTLGDVLTYTATATNSGNLTLSEVAVSDLLVSSGGNRCATLAVGAECELNGTYTVTQADVDAGEVVNTATATATGLTAVTKRVTTAVAQERALTLALSADVESFAGVGDTITYSYKVTNSGTVTLSGTVTITDNRIPAASITCDQGSPSGLAPGDATSCSGSYTTVQADVDASGVVSRATASLGGTSSAATLRVPWAATQGGVLPVLTIAGVGGGEDAGQFAFAVSLSAASQQTVTVAYATADGTATAGADYTGASGTLAFAPSETVKTIAVTVRDDELDETDESFTVELSAPSDEATPLNATFGGGGTTLSAPGTIADDDGTPVVGSGSAFDVAEGQTAVATLTATDQDHTAAELTWTIPPGTAGGADRAHFRLTKAGVLAFKAAKDYENPDDADGDGVYAVTVEVSDGVNAARAPWTVTLTDVAPAVTVAADAATVEEGTAAAFTLTRSGDLSGTQTVAVAVSQTGAVLATGQAGERQVTFTDGATEAALSVATDDDTVAEAGGTVTATVQPGTGYTLGASATAQVAVTDDDASGLTLTVQPDALAESDAATEVTVTAAWDTGTRAEATEVTVSVGGGSATSGTDYTAVDDFTLTIAATESTGTGTFMLTPTQDSVSEGDETIDVTGAATGFTVTKAEMTLTDDDPLTPLIDPDLDPSNLEDDDAAPRITSGRAQEAAEGQTAVAQLTATDDEQAPEELTWSIPEGTAGGADAAHFALTGAGVLTFKAAKDYENPDDANADGVYAVTVEVSDGDDNAVRANLSVTLTDVASAVTVAADAATVVEGTAAAFTLTRSGDLSGAQTVAVAVSQTGSVLATGEAGERQVTFTDGATEAALSVATDDDTVAEAGGTVTATVQSGTGYTLGASATAQVAVTDDDASGLTLTVQPDALAESDAATEVTVTAAWDTGTRAEATEVTVSVGGGSATSGTDYTAVDNLTLTIAATESTGSGTFTLTPKQDSVSEGSETIDVTGVATDFTVTKATMTLTDDETAPGTIALTTDPTSVGEDASATEVTVTATLGGSVTLAGATEVTVSVGGGTATSGTDYTAVDNLTLTIAATESTGSGTFTLTPTQDSVSEGSETIDVTGVATDFTVTKATMTLTDDETAPGTIALTTDPTSVGEDASATEVTVTATLGGSVTLAGATEVTVSVGGGTATSGTDYTAVDNFTLTIAATQSTGSGTFTLTPKQDSVSEGNETIDVTGTASGFTVTQAEITLTDDDQPATTQIALELDPGTVAEGAGATTITVTAKLSGDAQAASTGS